MKHKLLLSLFALFCLTGSSAWAQTTFVQGNLRYTLIGGKNVSVRGYSTSETYGNIVIPSTVTYGGTTYTVKEIEAAAFRNFTGITGLTIPASVEIISRAFIDNCTALKSLTIKDAETPLYFQNDYATYTFTDMYELCSSELDNYYQGRNIDRAETGNNKFITSAKKITLGGSMTYIPDYFTKENTALTELTIGGNITEIGREAFDENTNLTKVTFNSPIVTINQSAFWGCEALENIELPQTLKTLGPAVFRNCTSLKALTIPASVEIISRAFIDNCTALKSLTIEDSEASLYFQNDYATYVFTDMYELCTSELDNYYQGRNIDRAEVGEYKVITSAKKITLGGSMTYIPDFFTQKDAALTEVTIGGNITEIGREAFDENTNLTKVTFNSPIVTIYQSAFWGCEALENIELPQTLKTLGPAVFRNCTSLKALTIPASTESIGRAFIDNCTALKSLTIEDSEASLYFQNDYDTYQFVNMYELCTSNLDNYYQGRNIDRAEVGEYKVITSAKKITLGGSMTYIPAFFTQLNAALTEVIIGGNITEIGREAFDENTNLTKVTLNSPIVTIYQSAFWGCEALENIELPQTVKTLGPAVFRNCTSLKTLTIPASVEVISRGLIHNCTALKSLIIEDSEASLYFQNDYGTYQFVDMYELCTSDLDELYVGRNIDQAEASRLASKAKKLTFGQHVTAIGTLYNYIADLERVVAPWQTPISIDENAFAEATYLSAFLLVPNGTKQAYASAQGWRNFRNIQTRSIPVTLQASAHGTISTKYGKATNGGTFQFNQPRDESIVYTLTADEGYRLSALTDNGTAVSPLPDLGTEQSRAIGNNEESVTLSATFAPINYTIAYNLAGGRLGSGVTNRTTYNIETATFTLNNPIRDHYDFAGWTGTDLTAPTKTVTIAKGSTGNRSYTATWTPKTYTVTITGAGVTASNYSPKYGESVTITIVDDPDRTLTSLTVNGTDVTSQVRNNRYIITNISSDIEVVATFRSTKEFITMTGEYATFSCPQDLDFTGSSLRAYIASGFNKSTNQVLLTPITDVPAETGVFLIGSAGETYKIPYATTSSIYMNFFQANLTRKTISATTGSYSNYTFGEQGGEPGFYPINGSTTLQAQTAYLQLPTNFVTAGVKVSVVFEDDIVDGINEVNDQWSTVDGQPIYNLSGQRLGKMQKGINIVGGKKVLVK